MLIALIAGLLSTFTSSYDVSPENISVFQSLMSGSLSTATELDDAKGVTTLISKHEHTTAAQTTECLNNLWRFKIYTSVFDF